MEIEKENLNIRRVKSYRLLNGDGFSRNIGRKYRNGINQSKDSGTADESTAKDLLKTLDDSSEPQTVEDGEENKKSDQDELIKLAVNVELFHDRTGTTFARVPVEGHWEIWPVRSRKIRTWLIGEYYNALKKPPKSDAVKQALEVFEAKALYKGREIELSVRTARQEDAIWYDLGNGQAVKITSGGWEVVKVKPILFSWSGNTAKQVLPLRVGKREILNVLNFVNLKSETDKMLFVVSLVSNLIPDIPHAVTVWHGEKGAAKSTAMRVQRKLVDPAFQELQILPRSQEGLALSLYKNWCPSFDNIDGLPGAISDILCTAATGGGISKRALFTDSEDVILNFRRCVSLNGITVAATKPDLLDRALLFELDRIPENRRRSESEFWQEFEEARPRIFGGMLQVLSDAMKILPDVKLDKLPRMADFARWGYAIAEAIHPGGGYTFINALESNKQKANEEAVSANPVAQAIVVLINAKGNWEGTAAELLTKLEEIALSEKIDMRSKTWPKSPKSLAKRILHVKSNLIDSGINFAESRDTHLKKAIYSLKKAETNPPNTAKPATLDTPEFTLAESMRKSAESNFTNPPVNPPFESVSQAGCGFAETG